MFRHAFRRGVYCPVIAEIHENQPAAKRLMLLKGVVNSRANICRCSQLLHQSWRLSFLAAVSIFP